jgi:hypothetical protein
MNNISIFTACAVAVYSTIAAQKTGFPEPKLSSGDAKELGIVAAFVGLGAPRP